MTRPPVPRDGWCTVPATRRRVLTGTVAGALLAAAPLGAQATALDARADSLTLGGYCRGATRLLADTAVTAAVGGRGADARAARDLLCAPSLAAMPLSALTGAGPVPLRAVARREGDGRRLLARAALVTAVDTLFAVLGDDAVRARTAAVLGDSAAVWTRTVITARQLLVRSARDSSLARLARYERKLGPGSAALNGLEVLLNYGAQRALPGFRPSARRGPSPWELLASYAPTWVTVTDRATAVSASEFGLRRYLFGPAFGATGWRGVLRPTWWSAGALIVSDRDGALVWPWEGRTRTGVFAAWGGLKVAVVPGRRGAVLVSHQAQLVPFLF
jgi:hypothetical protein